MRVAKDTSPAHVSLEELPAGSGVSRNEHNERILALSWRSDFHGVFGHPARTTVAKGEQMPERGEVIV